MENLLAKLRAGTRSRKYSSFKRQRRRSRSDSQSMYTDALALEAQKLLQSIQNDVPESAHPPRPHVRHVPSKKSSIRKPVHDRSLKGRARRSIAGTNDTWSLKQAMTPFPFLFLFLFPPTRPLYTFCPNTTCAKSLMRCDLRNYVFTSLVLFFVAFTISLRSFIDSDLRFSVDECIRLEPFGHGRHLVCSSHVSAFFSYVEMQKLSLLASVLKLE